MRRSALAIAISKSKYMAGVQCLKRLYLLVHSPELGSGKTAADFALMEQGREIGKPPRDVLDISQGTKMCLQTGEVVPRRVTLMTYPSGCLKQPCPLPRIWRENELFSVYPR